MTICSLTPPVAPPLRGHEVRALAELAHQYLGLALRFDYLSSGRGHQQLRRVVRERHRDRTQGARFGLGKGGGLEAPSRGALDSDAEQRYLAAVARRARLSGHEEYVLARRAKAGDAQAGHAMVEANLGLVVMMARRYVRPGLPLIDLVAEGNLGLLRALSRFDPERGFRFATYAKWWVRQSIQMALPRLSPGVELPSDERGHGNGVGHDQGSEPAMGAVARETVPADMGAGAAGADRPEGVRFAGHGAGEPASELDMLPDDPVRGPLQQAMLSQRRALLVHALGTLSEREQAVVVARFALSGGECQTLDRLATQYQVSIERIRQIERAAVKKLGQQLAAAGVDAAAVL